MKPYPFNRKLPFGSQYPDWTPVLNNYQQSLTGKRIRKSQMRHEGNEERPDCADEFDVSCPLREELGNIGYFELKNLNQNGRTISEIFHVATKLQDLITDDFDYGIKLYQEEGDDITASYYKTGSTCRVENENLRTWAIYSEVMTCVETAPVGWTSERKARQAMLIRTWRPWEQATGPKSAQGKARVARNAWRGGHRQQLRKLLSRINAGIQGSKKLANLI